MGLQRISSKRPSRFWFRKGGYPVSIQQIMHPKHHQSTGLPCPSFLITSGAKYSGVPQMDMAWSQLDPIALDRPKSVSFRQPDLSKRTFSGLRLHQKQKLLSIDYVVIMEDLNGQDHLSRIEFGPGLGKNYCYQESLSFKDNRPKSYPPGQYYRMKQSFLSSWKEQYSLTKKGWLRCARMFFSVIMFSHWFFSMIYFFFRDFMAYTWLSSLDLTSKTFAQVPFPMTEIKVKSFMLLPIFIV